VRDLLTCKDCPKGFYTNDQKSLDGVLRFNRCQGCPRGTWSDQINLETAGNCTNCSTGRFNDIEARMQPCIQCDVGKYSTEIANVKDSMCTNCESGRFSTKIGASFKADCQACPMGKYSASVGVSQPEGCVKCSLGLEQSQTGMSYW
jgi:hypothetical protein